MIGDAFFPGESEIARLLGALATFGAGFLHATDRRGRHRRLRGSGRAPRRADADADAHVARLGMVALTPTYAQIGLAAPIILVVARLIQGFSCGGEVGAGHDLSPRIGAQREARGRDGLAGLQSAARGVHRAASSASCSAATLSREQLYDMGLAGAFPPGHAHRAGRPVHPPPASRNDRRTTRRIDSGAAVLVDLVRHHACEPSSSASSSSAAAPSRPTCSTT